MQGGRADVPVRGSTVYGVMDVRRSGDRYPGGEPDTGIESFHAFSFGPHYDPDNLRFGSILACNEERLAPGAGFDEHPHSHTEIVTWVVPGRLTHRDSTGHESVVAPGDVQRLSAGGGVRHVERNDGPDPLVFVQMWLAPLEPGGDPVYEVVHGIADSTPYDVPGPAPCCMCAASDRGSEPPSRTRPRCTSMSFTEKWCSVARSWVRATRSGSPGNPVSRPWRQDRRNCCCGRWPPAEVSLANGRVPLRRDPHARALTPRRAPRP